MIQANELRIGNTVISNGQVYDIRCGEDIDWLSFEPMPLTEEWLLNFGFEETYWQESGKFAHWDKNGISWLDKDMKCIIWYKIAGIKHVHALQNLYFALTGSELVLSNVPEATKPAL